MAEFLYPAFLIDSAEYARAEETWRGAWDALNQSSAPHADWKSPWLKTSFANGAPCRDGNPIFSAFSPRSRRGIRVLQLEPLDDPDDLDFWTDVYAKGDPEEIKELVIACVLTGATLADATDLMAQWIERGEVTLSEYLGTRRRAATGAAYDRRQERVDRIPK